MGKRLEANAFDFPQPQPLENFPECQDNMPYFNVGDDAFEHSVYMEKPYSGQNLTLEQILFNYRLSRA